MKASAILYLDIRIVNKDGTSCVKVRVTHNRQQKYYRTNVYLTPEEWQKVNSNRVPKELRQAKSEVMLALSKALSVIDELKVFSFDLFETHYSRNKISRGALVDLYTEKIEQLRGEGRISTAISYEYSLASLCEFQAKLNFEHITVDLLNRYEKWMVSKGKSLTTVGIYLRALRAIYSEAIDKALVSRALYPFGKRKYVIPSGKGIKKALEIADVKGILHYPTEKYSTLDKARDFWIFSYLCNGINIKDIARLRHQNIDGDFLRFVRSKTQRSTKANAKTISVHLLPEMKAIIKKWGNKDKTKNSYLFPILTEGLTPEREYALIQQFTKTINKYMRIVADDLKISKDVTTYTARHTFSTVLKRSGASVEYIQEALGHTDKSTTETYLDSFEEDTKKKFSEKLLQF